MVVFVDGDDVDDEDEDVMGRFLLLELVLTVPASCCPSINFSAIEKKHSVHFGTKEKVIRRRDFKW